MPVKHGCLQHPHLNEKISSRSWILIKSGIGHEKALQRVIIELPQDIVEEIKIHNILLMADIRHSKRALEWTTLAGREKR